ncbi:MAG: flippase-like domain-containing protein [Desulfobacterales bacterium]|jgi:hypothetical protein|nr:flippase-like domain-containing protein [Desulfobacterales bacterium]
MTKRSIHVAAGLIIGAGCVWLALRGVDFREVGRALGAARYGYVAAALAAMMLGHYLRALRWRCLLVPVRPVATGRLFSALMIGYAANSFVPAHLGELLRAFVIGKTSRISAGAAFASIVVERIIDVISLIGLMALVVIVHPFPPWVEASGVLMLAGALLLLAVLIGSKRFAAQTIALLRLALKPLPERLGRRVESLALNFLDGIQPLPSAGHYLAVGLLSAAIWTCYAAVYYLCLAAFDLTGPHALPWHAGMVVLVLTTVSVVVPSTPGYVGTFHYLCQVALAMFGVPASEGLSYAIVAHAVGILPVTLLGLVAAQLEGVAIVRTAHAIQKEPPGGGGEAGGPAP